MSEPQYLQVDGLDVIVHRRSRRTIGLTIDRNGAVILAAPLDCPADAIESTIRRRRLWLQTRLDTRQSQRSAEYNREFVSGEGFVYRGRSYRLLLTNSTEEPAEQPLILRDGRFLLARQEESRAREHFISWYTHRAGHALPERIAHFGVQLGISAAAVTIRDLGYRWGICQPNGQIALHWRTILLPPRAIDYIAAHEVTHLAELSHTRPFWHLLRRILPDYAERRSWLAQHGAAYDL